MNIFLYSYKVNILSLGKEQAHTFRPLHQYLMRKKKGKEYS